jgi:hypothetical protein
VKLLIYTLKIQIRYCISIKIYQVNGRKWDVRKWEQKKLPCMKKREIVTGEDKNGIFPDP